MNQRLLSTRFVAYECKHGLVCCKLLFVLFVLHLFAFYVADTLGAKIALSQSEDQKTLTLQDRRWIRHYVNLDLFGFDSRMPVNSRFVHCTV